MHRDLLSGDPEWSLDRSSDPFFMSSVPVLVNRSLLACLFMGLLGGLVPGTRLVVKTCEEHVHACSESHDHHEVDPCTDSHCPDRHGDSQDHHHHHRGPCCFQHHAGPLAFFELPATGSPSASRISRLAFVIEHDDVPDPPFLAEDEPPLV
jgi:hypothetical protein